MEILFPKFSNLCSSKFYLANFWQKTTNFNRNISHACSFREYLKCFHGKPRNYAVYSSLLDKL